MVSIPQWCDCCDVVNATFDYYSSVFQSHNGAIAARSIFTTFTTISLFQSHNGAIAARIESSQPIILAMFQSHNGAIAATNLSFSVNAFAGFNPTMVRLLRARDCANHFTFCLFQSHNGAIAAWIREKDERGRDVFQSHNGAIAAGRKATDLRT